MITEVNSMWIIKLLFQLLSSQTVGQFKDRTDAGVRYSSQQACCLMNDIIQSPKLTPVTSPNYKGPRDQLGLEFKG